MTSKQRSFYILLLMVLSAGWGLTMPLTKIAVSTGHKHFGLIFWQMAIGVAVMTVIMLATRRQWRFDLPALRVYLIISLLGSVLPNTISYQVAVHLPSGVMSILISTVPMFSFPIAILRLLDRFEWRRLAGLGFGLAGVLVLIVPEADLQGSIPPFWAIVYMLSSLFYAFEGNYVAKWGTAGLDPLQVLWGASLVGMLLATPLVIGSGQWISPLPPYGWPELALVISSAVHVVVYAAFVWLITRAGPVFTSQIAYFVTLFGVLFAWVFLGETFGAGVWAALGLLLVGMFLVQPRTAPPAVEPNTPMGNTGT
ncbi:MAG: DMT family transporter [Rhodobacteraceae bacterium]|nr:DMT family transporter [Paracoccaceae bacterium]